MHYVFLIHHEPEGSADDDLERRHEAFLARQREEGRFVAFVQLDQPRETLFLRKPGKGAKAALTQGPQAEAKVRLTGVLVLQCSGPEEARALALDLPAAQDGAPVEVRPVFDLAAAVRGQGFGPYPLNVP
ncbi:MAG: hypothetical protein GC160_03295 [Acidobacteria bacterium]|nr:hypothetical protein [Acidobacteriota bacterium]